MSRSGSLKSYWSMISNIGAKSFGTGQKAKENRRIIQKLSGVKLSVSPTLKQVRKAFKNFTKEKKRRAKLFQKEVNTERKLQGRKDKISLKDAFELMPDYLIDGTSSEDFPTGESP